MKVRLLRSAVEDLAEGRQFYERQGGGVGEYFFNTLFAEIDSLSDSGGIHAKFHGYHRLIARRFPYAVYYQILDGEAVVFRVLDCRQAPWRIEKRLLRDE